MRIAVWATGHSIADTVAKSLADGLSAPIFDANSISKQTIKEYDAHIGYGILRGMDCVFRACDEAGKDWFNVDNGYLGSGHFDGYYRVSHMSTQELYRDIDHDRTRLGVFNPLFLQWREPVARVLICPPTPAVRIFFGVKHDWQESAVNDAMAYMKANNIYRPRIEIRNKGDDGDIDYNQYGLIYVYNSSVAWKALQHGVAARTNTDNCVLNYWHNRENDYRKLNRADLFSFMANNQWTLKEIRQGLLRPIIKGCIT